MDPLLARRWSPGFPLRRSGAEPDDEIEALRRIVRFVWTSATLVGVIGRERRAAAAAAADKDGLASRCLLNTAAAAVAALGSAVAELRGLFWEETVSITSWYL